MSNPAQNTRSVETPVGRPVRIQLRRTKGWKMPPNTVSVARPTRFGNPHPVGWCCICGAEHKNVHEAVAEFRAMLDAEAVVCMGVRELLAGKNLACWCPLWVCMACLSESGETEQPTCCGHKMLRCPCHADVLLEAANNAYPTTGSHNKESK